MHVLHLHSGNLYGGIERVLTTLARCGLGAGTRQSFGLCFEGRLSAELRAAGATVHLLGEVRASRPRSVFATRRHLRGWLSVNPVDVIVTHLPWAQAVFGPAAADRVRSRVQWVHGPIEGWIGRWAARSLPDALICNSAFTAATLPHAYKGLPATVLHYPLEAAAGGRVTRAEVRASLSTEPDAVVIVQASRYEAWKGHEVLVRALARLAHVEGWALWIVGGAQRPGEVAYERRLRSLVDGFGLSSRVRFAGEQSDVAGYLAAADIYCQPNTGPEPFGLVFVEALAAGLPVVASDAGALREIVDDATGVLVAPGDVTALAAALERLLSDGDERRRLGAAGPRRASQLCDPERQSARVGASLASMLTREAGAA